MYKKIVLMLSAIIIFSLPFQQQYAESAILSKVASKGAQKIVKEVIKESAFDIAVNLFLDEAYKMAETEQAKYQAQSDYELFCGKKMPDLITCEKPMQVKKVLTTTDKTNIGNQAEIELDKLITGGKGFTRWQKFLDWFLPIWVASFALTAITYAVDPEVKSLFNEAGYNALVALGIIKPVGDKTEISEFETVQKPTPVESNGTVIDGYTTKTQAETYRNSNDLTMSLSPAIPYIDVLTKIDYRTPEPTGQIMNEHNVHLNGVFHFGITNPNQSSAGFTFNADRYTGATQLTVSLNNQVIQNSPITPSAGNNKVLLSTTAKQEIISIMTQRENSIMTRTPYEIGGFLYTDVLITTPDGNKLKYQLKHTGIATDSLSSVRISNPTVSTYMLRSVQITVFPNQKPYANTVVPDYEEVETEIAPIAVSKYEKDGQIALIPPSALPYTQTSTGIQLTPETDPNTGEQKFTTPTGESIPEDDITVGEPNVQDNPSPAPNTVTPPATSTNPNPEPIPLTPATPTTPPPPPPTPVETLPPVFPEGESCEVGLKLPKISPLAYAVSESFPFSIPFDLYDGFQAIFSELGTEKPEFNYKFNFMGEQQDWKISIPDYFDSWKRFTDSFIIFIFDVGIIFMIFRFMGGSK